MNRSVYLAIALAGAMACRPVADDSFGEPVGIRIETSSRKLMVRLATIQHEDIEPYVEGLAGAIAKVAAVCLKDGSAVLQFEIVGGVIRFPRHPGAEPERCLAEALDGKRIGEAKSDVVHLQLRVSPE